jgi:hypothetical protein
MRWQGQEVTRCGLGEHPRGAPIRPAAPELFNITDDRAEACDPLRPQGRLDSQSSRDIFTGHVVAFASWPTSARLHRTRPTIRKRPASERQQLDSRNQIRRVPHAGASRWPHTVRLFTRNGYDWTERFPLIRAGMAALRVRSCLIDGEAVCCEVDGVPSFELLRYRQS